ncbi:MAG: collagen-like protein [Bacteroidales bacterium]|nr:collagen-like protein [Bacteroidales bacterium]
MKKLLFLMLPLLALMLLGSCRGDEGPMGPEGPAGPAGLDGRDGQDGRDGLDGEGMKTLDFDFTVEQNDWTPVLDTEEPYFKFSFENFAELETKVIEQGMVSVNRVFGDGYYGAVPSVQLKKATNDNGDVVFYTQVIDYEFAPKTINFFVTNSDFYMDEKPETMTFRVVVQYY